MLIPLLLWASHSGSAAESGEMRSFTDVQGRSIEAALTAVSGENVTIQRADGRTFTLPSAGFSEADQE